MSDGRPTNKHTINAGNNDGSIRGNISDSDNANDAEDYAEYDTDNDDHDHDREDHDRDDRDLDYRDCDCDVDDDNRDHDHDVHADKNDYDSHLQWEAVTAASTGRKWEQNMMRCKNLQNYAKCNF